MKLTVALLTRSVIIETCLRYVLAIAGRYKREVHHDSDMDLVGVGNVAIMECIDIALTKENPYGYLRRTASRAIMLYCYTCSSMVMKTKQYTESLDTPIYEDGKTILADQLAAPESEPEPEPSDYTGLYEELNELPEGYREVLARHYGLCGRPIESLYEISQDIGKPGPKSSAAYTREYRALRILREHLDNQPNVAA